MLVRRFSAAAVQDFHRLSSHILMDAGELGSRNMTVTWIEVPPDTEQVMRRDEDERGRGREGGRGGSRRRYDEDSGGGDRGSAEPAAATAGADSE